MKNGPTIRSLGVAVALGLCLPAGAARATADGVRAGRPAVSSPGVIHRVDEHIRRDLAGGCTYEARVSGTVREIKVDEPASVRARYAPRLSVDAQVRCPESVGSHRTAQVAPVPDYSRRQLADELALRGRVVTSRNGEVCSFHPELTFDEGRIAVEGVAGGCGLARGGGPRASNAPAARRASASDGNSYRMVSRDGRDVQEYVDFAAHGSPSAR